MSNLRLTLHHVGYAVGAIDPISEIYVSRFGYKLSTPILHDRLHNAYVQFLRLSGDQAYLELVAPDGAESKLNNAVKRGSGLNHLCYACGPIEEAIAHFESKGMRLLSKPKPGFAFAGRRIGWLLGSDPLLVELVERRGEEDHCDPGAA